MLPQAILASIKGNARFERAIAAEETCSFSQKNSRCEFFCEKE
jgi:hypothetical protein